MNSVFEKYRNSPRITHKDYWNYHLDSPHLKDARSVLKVSKERQKEELAELAVSLKADQHQFERVVKEYLKRNELDFSQRHQTGAHAAFTHKRPVFGRRFGRF